MQLPGHFLADLPPEAKLTPAMVREACLTVKRNRLRHLLPSSTPALLGLLSECARQWLRESDPFRQLALAEGPEVTGFPAATLARGLDAFFSLLTEENLDELLVGELGDAAALDGLIATPGLGRSRRERVHLLALGPELLAHVTAGNLPTAGLMNLVLGLLVRSAQFVKCARGGAFLPRLFAHSIRQIDPTIGGCLELAEWRGGNVALEEALFEQADCLTATGSEETLADIRRRLPARVRLVAHGHRVSLGFIAADALAHGGAARWAARAADDVTAWNQRGCLSPHLIYVQTAGVVGPETFAELLAAELARREESEPRGAIPVEEAAQIASRREIHAMRGAASGETRVLSSENSTAWTVVFEQDPRFQLSCLNRFVYVKPVADLSELLRQAEVVRGQVSTVGLAASEPHAAGLVTELARWGITRICPLGRMQTPPLTWRHDGRPALGELVTWTGWERHYAD